MGESIFVRMQRVVSAQIDTAVSTAERANRSGMMREAVREADRAIDRVVSDRDAAAARGRTADAQTAALRRELVTLEEHARFALSKGRADLAEAAVVRQVDVDGQIAATADMHAQASADVDRLEAVIADLRNRRRAMAEEVTAARDAERAVAGIAVADTPVGMRMEQKLGRAEAAFSRALSQDGGGDGRIAAQVAEIAALRKQELVAARMAALQAGQPFAPKPAKDKAANRAPRPGGKA